MKKLLILTALCALAISSSAFAVAWAPGPNYPVVSAYADNPALTSYVYRMASTVFDGNVTFVGGRDFNWGALVASDFGQFNPGLNAWVAFSDGSDDIDNGDGTYTSVGIPGYNNGNGNFSPLKALNNGMSETDNDSACEFNNKLYVYGGAMVGDAMSIYDPATNGWAVVPGVGVASMAGGAKVGSDFYVARQGVAGGALGDFDLAANMWKPDVIVPTLPKLSTYSTNGVYANHIYFVDTYDAPGAGNVAGAVYKMWIPAVPGKTGAAIQKSAAPVPIGQSGSVVWNGCLYIMGGRQTGGGDSATGIIEVYDIGRDKWIISPDTLPNEPATKRSGLYAELVGTTLVIGGGYSGATGTLLGDVWTCDIRQIRTPGIPEPGTIMLIGSGLVGLVALLRKRG